MTMSFYILIDGQLHASHFSVRKHKTAWNVDFSSKWHVNWLSTVQPCVCVCVRESQPANTNQIFRLTFANSTFIKNEIQALTAINFRILLLIRSSVLSQLRCNSWQKCLLKNKSIDRTEFIFSRLLMICNMTLQLGKSVNQ